MAAAVSAVLVAGGGAALSSGAALAVNIGAYVVMLGASTYLQQGMQEKQKTGTKLNTVLGGDVPQSFGFGQFETAGSFLYIGSTGISGKTPNGFLSKVFCLSDRPVEDFLARFWGSGRKCTITNRERSLNGHSIGFAVDEFQIDGEDHLWVKILTGSQTTADGYLRAEFGSGARAWTADMIGRGRVIAIVTQKYNRKEPAGEVDPLFVISRGKFYDWRDGDQVYGDYSTYDWDPGNPIVVARNIMQGVYYGDNSEWMFGGQAWPHTCFDNDTWTAAANVCDENKTNAGGGTRKRYRVGGEVNLSEEPWTVVERLLDSCSARLADCGGVYKVYAGGIGASVASITDDDVLVSEEVTGALYRSREESANTIVGTYSEPDNAGEAKPFKARTNATYLAEDGGSVRKLPLDLPYVRDNRQAQEVAHTALNDNRRFRSFILGCWTWARKLEGGDVITWTSARWGFTSKKFLIERVKLRRDGPVIINLREVDSADADFTTGDETSFETGVYDEIDTPTQTLTATVTPVAITDDDNTTKRAPAVRIQASLDDDFVDCNALLYQVRKRNGDKKIIARGRSEGFFEPGNPEYGDITFTSAAFKSGKEVQVRYKIEPESDRETAWSDDWSTTTSFITLDTARLKIATPSDDNDIDLVVTDNIATKQIWSDGSFTYSKSDPTKPGGYVTISGGGGDKETFANIGDVPISNPNKTPVFINFEYDIAATTTSGTAKLEVTLSSSRGGGDWVELRTITATAKNNSGDATADTDRPNGRVVVMDDAWSSSDSKNRTYRVGMVLTRVGANAGGRVFSSRITLTWGLR